jgi:hypothetical protein
VVLLSAVLLLFLPETHQQELEAISDDENEGKALERVAG